MKWPDFCSALIVRRLVPLDVDNTRFPPLRVPCSPGTGAGASSPRHETHRNVADSRSLESWKGLRRQTSSVLYAPSALSAMALSYESPTVPVEGSMPNSPTLVVYTRLMYCAPWSLLNRCRFNSDHGTQCIGTVYTTRVMEYGMLPSTGTVGDSCDNAMAESADGAYRTELVWRRKPFADLKDLELATFRWVSWWNSKRLHQSLGYRTPERTETEYYANQAAQAAPL